MRHSKNRSLGAKRRFSNDKDNIEDDNSDIDPESNSTDDGKKSSKAPNTRKSKRASTTPVNKKIVKKAKQQWKPSPDSVSSKDDNNDESDSYEPESDRSYSIDEQSSKAERVTKAKPTPTKTVAKRRNEKTKNQTKAISTDSGAEEVDYEVDEIVDVKTKSNGSREFLIKWKGFSTADNTWENESNLNCSALIAKFMEDQEEKSLNTNDNTEDSTTPQTKKKAAKLSESPKKTGKETKGTNKQRRSTNKTTTNDEEEYVSNVHSRTKGKRSQSTSSSSDVYEVDKIIDVYFKRDGSKEFLVHWHGYSAVERTWEPEENLNCADLIAKYMDKVENAKSFEHKELRERRAHTVPFTLAMNDGGRRRLSKRNKDKQRVFYHDAE